MALSDNRYTDYFREGKTSIPISFPVAASTHIYKGSHVAWDASGNLVPCSSSLALKYAGLAEDEADNSDGIAGAISCRVYLSGVDTLPKSGTITDANRCTLLQFLDDNTVALALAYAESAMTGSNNDIRVTAKAPWDGLAGENISFEILASTGNNISESCEVKGSQIIITPSTGGGGAITSTPTTIAATVAAHAKAGRMVTVTNKGTDTGAAAVTALPAMSLILAGPVAGPLEKMNGSLAVMRWVAGGRR